MPLEQSIQAYYDDHNMRVLVRDYVYGNKRFDRALQFAIDATPDNLKRILDVGCGIGYSSWLLKKAFPEAHILGIDISDASIELARKLFRDPELSFETRDFVSSPPKALFDLVVMLDMYEHIPRKQRPSLCSTLHDLIDNDGWLVITTPTVEHQTFLRERHPDRLQIVDEDVTLDDLRKLANALSMTAVRLERIAVWNVYDYQHFAACRLKEFKELPAPRPPGFVRKATTKFINIFRTNSQEIRHQKIKELLGFDPLSKE